VKENPLYFSVVFRLIESKMRNNISIGPVLIKSSVKKEIIVRTNEIPVMIDNIFDKFFIVIRPILN
jgi:hypothetical protein